LLVLCVVLRGQLVQGAKYRIHNRFGRFRIDGTGQEFFQQGTSEGSAIYRSRFVHTAIASKGRARLVYPRFLAVIPMVIADDNTVGEKIRKCLVLRRGNNCDTTGDACATQTARLA